MLQCSHPRMREEQALEDVFRLLREMLHRSLAPDVVDYSASISAYEEGRHWGRPLAYSGSAPQIAHVQCGKLHGSHPRVWEG